MSWIFSLWLRERKRVLEEKKTIGDVCCKTIKTIPFKLVFRVILLCSDFFVVDKISIAHFILAELIFILLTLMLFCSCSFFIIVALRRSLLNSSIEYIMNNTVELMTTDLHTNTTITHNRIIKQTAVEKSHAST